MGWTHDSDVFTYSYPAKSIGYFLAADNDYIRLAKTMGHDGAVNGDHGIPLGMIQSIRRLK